MAIVDPPPRIAPSTPPPRGRDTGIDLLRAICVIGVVVLHAVMVGVTVVDGAPEFANASEGEAWIVPLSWVLQVMPLFFVIGGFAGLHSWRRLRERGGSAGDFVAARVHRLLRPAVVVIGVVGVLLAALAVAGVPADLVATAGYRYGQPLWFLAVFLLCQSLLPALASAHTRRPILSILLLVVGAGVVDLLRALTGIEGLGMLNLAFVWLSLQQLGFFLADGTVHRLSRRVRAAVGGVALVLLAAAFTGGLSSPDLIAHINPPTAALILVGVVQLSAVSLLRDRIEAFSRRPRCAALSAFVNARTMTVYLWHMPVLLGMAGVSALIALSTGLALPEPSSAEWWLTRPLWLGAALILTAVVAVALARYEAVRAPRPTRSARGLVLAVALGLSSVVLLLAVGTTVLTAAVAVAGLVAALRLARRSDETARRESVADVIRVA